MSVPSLSDLLVSPTQDEWTAIALAQLQGKNFPTTDWSSTSPELAMLLTDTACLADQSQQIPAIVALVLVQYAAGNIAPTAPASLALQFVAFNWYEIEAFQPTATIGTCALSCATAAGPYTIAVNQLLATDGAGNIYTNTQGGTLTAGSGGILSGPWQSQVAGTAANVANSTITALLTPLPGVTINNPAPPFSPVSHTGSGTGTVTPSGATPAAHSWIVRIDTSGIAGTATCSYSLDGGTGWTSEGTTNPFTPGGSGTTITLAGTFVAGDRYFFSAPGSWITTAGTDVESTQSLTARCLARWPALASIPTTSVYQSWAYQSVPGQITRVLIETDPSLAATVNIYCAGPSAPITGAQQNAAQAYIDVRAGLTDLPVVLIAGSTGVTITGTATYPAGQTQIPTQRNAAINAYVNTIIMGGTIEVAIIEALALALNAAGVPTGAINISGVQLNGGGVGVDLVLPAHNVANVTNSISWVGV